MLEGFIWHREGKLGLACESQHETVFITHFYFYIVTAAFWLWLDLDDITWIRKSF